MACRGAAGREALGLARVLDAPDLIVQALNRLAWIRRTRGRSVPVLSEEAAVLARTLGDPLLPASSLQHLARSYRHNNPSRALELQSQAMTFGEAEGDAKRLGHGHMNMAYRSRSAAR